MSRPPKLVTHNLWASLWLIVRKEQKRIMHVLLKQRVPYGYVRTPFLNSKGIGKVPSYEETAFTLTRALGVLTSFYDNLATAYRRLGA